MISYERDYTFEERGDESYRVRIWHRWVCTCGAAGSWLHDEDKVKRMSQAHAVVHVAREARSA